jgi:hypothetical protein
MVSALRGSRRPNNFDTQPFVGIGMQTRQSNQPPTDDRTWRNVPQQRGSAPQTAAVAPSNVGANAVWGAPPATASPAPALVASPAPAPVASPAPAPVASPAPVAVAPPVVASPMAPRSSTHHEMQTLEREHTHAEMDTIGAASNALTASGEEYSGNIIGNSHLSTLLPGQHNSNVASVAGLGIVTSTGHVLNKTATGVDIVPAEMYAGQQAELSSKHATQMTGQREDKQASEAHKVAALKSGLAARYDPKNAAEHLKTQNIHRNESKRLMKQHRYTKISSNFTGSTIHFLSEAMILIIGIALFVQGLLVAINFERREKKETTTPSTAQTNEYYAALFFLGVGAGIVFNQLIKMLMIVIGWISPGAEEYALHALVTVLSVGIAILGGYYFNRLVVIGGLLSTATIKDVILVPKAVGIACVGAGAGIIFTLGIELFSKMLVTPALQVKVIMVAIVIAGMMLVSSGIVGLLLYYSITPKFIPNLIASIVALVLGVAGIGLGGFGAWWL